jgi:diguanylate cyclase (GGDEF)-like protein
MNEAAHILLVTELDATRQRWSDSLRDCDLRVTTPDELTAGQDVDVILTDHALSADLERLARDGASVIRVGSDEECDLRLDAAASDAEIRLACRLQARISRLTRERDLGEHERATLADLTLTDPLTGLRNRRAWDQQAGPLAGAANGVCLLLIDLDLFKRINETQGHAVGDSVLRAAATALQASLRPGDFIVRLGGDEFAVLLPELPVQATERVVERIRQAILCHTEAAGGRVTGSVGYVVSAVPVGLEELFAAADHALRAAKVGGRDQAVQGELAG